MQDTTKVPLVIRSNPSRFFKRAFLFTMVSFFSLIFFMGIKSSNVDPIKMQIGSYVSPFIWMITGFLWWQYCQMKQSRLNITNDIISWGNSSKATLIDLTNLRHVSAVELSDLNAGSGLQYEFTLTNSRPEMGNSLSFIIDDYDISQNELDAVLKELAQRHNFRFEAYLVSS